MHELSIAMSILESLQEETDQRGLGPVEAIHIRVGALSGVVPDALQSAYELAAEQTPFADSRLVIEELPIVIYCAECSRNQVIASSGWLCCPVCRNPSSELVSGRELEISALEVAT
jgi:hydrogenase nickel incorporation protein HypA/HybF